VLGSGCEKRLVVEILDFEIGNVEALKQVDRHVILPSAASVRAHVENDFTYRVGNDGLIHLDIVLGLIRPPTIGSSIAVGADPVIPDDVRVSFFYCHDRV